MDVQSLLDEFPGYLEQSRLALPHHVPFLQRWAARYLAAPCDSTLKPDDRLRAFLDGLRGNPRVAAT